MLRMIAAAGVAVTAAGLIACGEGLMEADVNATVEARVAEAFIQATAEARVMESLAPPATPIPTGRIAFVSGDPEDGIYVMDADGSDALYTVRQIQAPPRQTLTLILRPHGSMALQSM